MSDDAYGATVAKRRLSRQLLQPRLNLNPPRKLGSSTARQRRKCPLNWDDGSC